MAGHSKWSKVKRFKGALDAKRGRLFSKLSKEITVAAKLGGGNPSANPRLRAAIQAARAQSMPNDNVDRAIKKGAGELGSETVEEIIYEGLRAWRRCLDCRDRHRQQEPDRGGHAFHFHEKSRQPRWPRKRIFHVPSQRSNHHTAFIRQRESLFELVAEAGAEDLSSDGEHHIITTPPDQLYVVSEALRKASLEPDSQRLTYIPESSVAVEDAKTAAQVLRLCDALDNCDDVLNVHANFEIPDDILAKAQEN